MIVVLSPTCIQLFFKQRNEIITQKLGLTIFTAENSNKHMSRNEISVPIATITGLLDQFCSMFCMALRSNLIPYPII